ncbi:MAG: caspase family protein [Bacteroidota bacterium]
MSDTNPDTPPSTVQLPFRNSHAFIIGINAYKHLSPLSTAVNDAKVIANCLGEQHHFQVHAPLLDADHQSIRQLLTQTIPAIVKEDDRVLFYFAGHGIALDSEKGPNGYLVAADTRPGEEQTLISMQLLHDAITGLPCRHGLLILDCCFSGAFKWSSGFRDVVFDLPKIIYEERFWRYCKDPAWQVITSAAHDQKAVDIITNQSLGLRETSGGMHSPFAASLLKALDGEGDVIPAGTGDGIMTATELYTYLRDSVENSTQENNKRQSPSIFNLSKHDKGEFIFLHPNHRFNLPPTPDRNPFMGLASYNEDDAPLFYGRDRVISALAERINTQNLLVVSGASGNGKSSVIKAGLLPYLRRNGYQILPVIRPGKEPFSLLKTTLKEEWNQLGDGPKVLVVDQYEELVTQSLDAEERQGFEQQLAAWLKAYPELRIVISVRSDFEPQFEGGELLTWWADARYVVPSFSLEEIREIITKPAAQAVLFYEPEELVEQLTEEVSQSPGALPLLSFTLSELYHGYLKSGREDRALTGEDYQKLGGVVGALRTRADAEYQRLNTQLQSSMRKLMLRMVSLEGGELAGKRIYAEELRFKDQQENARLQKVAQQLVDARLLFQGKDPQGRTFIEPAHDALVRAWARLWEWVKTVGEEKISLQYKLNQAVADYNDLLKTDSRKARRLLWNANPRLELLNAELSTKDHGLNAREEAFVQASVRRRNRRTRNSWIVALSVMAGLAILSFIANNQRILAEEQTEIAVRERNAALSNDLGTKAALTRTTNPTVSFRLAEASLEINPENTLSYGALLNAFYTSSFEQRTGLFYREVQGLPNGVFIKNRYTESPRSTLADRGAADYGVFRMQSSNSWNGRYYLMVNHAHYGSNKLEIYDYRRGTYSSRVLLDTECLFSRASFSRDDRYVIIPQQNVLEIYRPDAIDRPVYRLYAPKAIKQAAFDPAEPYVYAITYTGEIYRWNLDAFEIDLISNNRDLSNIHEVYFGTMGGIIINSDEGAEWTQWVRNDKGWVPSARKEDGNLVLPKNGQGFVIHDLQFTPQAHAKFSARGYDGYDSFGNPPDPSKYPFQLLGERRIVRISDQVNGGDPVDLIGHKLPIQSLSVSNDGQKILTTSDGETKMWDWKGNEIFQLDRGGVGGFVPQQAFIWLVLSDPEQEFTEFARNKLELIPIGKDLILEWVNSHNIYQLSAEDQQKYGVGF